MKTYTSITDKTIHISALRKRFGEIEKKLPYVDYFVLTKKGKPFAILHAAPGVKRELMRKAFGAWKNTDLDNDALWKDVLKRKSRKTSISL